MQPPPNGQPPGQVPPVQPQQVVVLQGQPQQTYNRPQVYENYLKGQSMVLGCIQIGLGIIAIIVNAIAMKYDREDHNETNMSHSACGIWSGLFFILTGAFGITAARNKTMCHIVTFMVLSIISVSVINMAFLGLSIAGVAVANSDDCYWSSWGYPDYGSAHYCNGKNVGLLGTMATLLAIALIQPIIAIWSSVICCMAVCCGRRTPAQTVTTGTVQYSTVQGTGQQGQVIVINTGPGGYPAGQVTTTYPQQQGQVYVTGGNPAPAYPTQPVYQPNPAPAYPYPQQQAPPPQGQAHPPPATGPAPPAYNPSAPPPVYSEQVDVNVKSELH